MALQDIFSKPEVLWFMFGLLLILAELGIPGLIIIFFGLGAWVTALVCLFFDISLNLQLGIFLVVSVLSLALLRKYVKTRFFSAKENASETLQDEFIGRQAVAATAIQPGRNGKVEFKGTLWEAVSDTQVKKGQAVRITGKESITLQVEPLEQQT